jgi:hypothetical protein
MSKSKIKAWEKADRAAARRMLRGKVFSAEETFFGWRIVHGKMDVLHLTDCARNRVVLPALLARLNGKEASA